MDLSTKAGYGYNITSLTREPKPTSCDYMSLLGSQCNTSEERSVVDGLQHNVVPRRLALEGVTTMLANQQHDRINWGLLFHAGSGIHKDVSRLLVATQVSCDLD